MHFINWISVVAFYLKLGLAKWCWHNQYQRERMLYHSKWWERNTAIYEHLMQSTLVDKHAPLLRFTSYFNELLGTCWALHNEQHWMLLVVLIFSSALTHFQYATWPRFSLIQADIRYFAAILLSTTVKLVCHVYYFYKYLHSMQVFVLACKKLKELISIIQQP